MRKLPLILLLVIGLAITAVWPHGPATNPVRTGTADALLSLMGGIPGDALAQQLKFREVPPESAKRITRARATPRDNPEVDVPLPPDAPETPDVAEVPHRYSSRSGDIVRIGHDVHVERGELVQGDLVVMGGDVIVDGHVEGDVVAMGGHVQLNPTARVDGDVACIGGHLTQEDGAIVGGQRFTASGFRDFARQRARAHSDEEAERRSRGIVGDIVRLAMLVAIAWGFAALAPGRTQASLDTLKRQPAISLGVGALVFALIIPSIVALALIVAILCITIIGIPLALAALFGYVLFLVLMYVWGFAVISSWLGEWVLARRNTQTIVSAGAGGMIMPQGGVSTTQPSAMGTAGALATPSPTLVRKAVTGALLLGGARLLGELLKALGPLHGLGVFLIVLTWVAFAVGVTFGGGAWLRNEFTSGLIGRIWRGRRGGAARAAADPTPPSSPGPGGAPSPAPAPAPPPASTASFMPPPPPATAPPPPADPPPGSSVDPPAGPPAA